MSILQLRLANAGGKCTTAPCGNWYYTCTKMSTAYEMIACIMQYVSTMLSPRRHPTIQRNSTSSVCKPPTRQSTFFKLGLYTYIIIVKDILDIEYYFLSIWCLYSDSKELQSWIDTINFVCASFSCQPLAGAVGSQRKFQRPLLPCSHTKLNSVSVRSPNIFKDSLSEFFLTYHWSTRRFRYCFEVSVIYWFLKLDY